MTIHLTSDYHERDRPVGFLLHMNEQHDVYYSQRLKLESSEYIS